MAPGAGLRAVVFDWGGTLSTPLTDELTDLWRVAAQHLTARSAGSAGGAGAAAPVSAAALTERLLAVEAAVWAETTSTQRSFTLADILERAGRELGLSVRRAVIDEAAVLHLDAWTPHITHDPAAAEVLAEVRAAGLATGLLSNTHWPPSFHERFLRRDGLAPLLDVRCYTSTLAHVKPHPDAFAEVLGRLGVQPHEAVFVGDDPHDDISGAAAVGMRTVLRRHPGPLRSTDGPPAEAEISDLRELPALLRSWSEPAAHNGGA